MPVVTLSPLSRLILIIGVLSTCNLSIASQTTSRTIRPPAPNEIVDAQRSGPFSDDDQRLGSIEDEMRAKRAIRYAEENYKKNLERAREVAAIAKDLVCTFKGNNLLGREELKKLEKMEKLTKQIRSNAGGSNDKVRIDKPPRDLNAALNRVEEMSTSLQELVEKTPRQVVSASVIDEANVLLELINRLRSISH